MKIDIISYTDAQFAELSEEQILQVQQAQLQLLRVQKRLHLLLQHLLHTVYHL